MDIFNVFKLSSIGPRFAKHVIWDMYCGMCIEHQVPVGPTQERASSGAQAPEFNSNVKYTRPKILALHSSDEKLQHSELPKAPLRGEGNLFLGPRLQCAPLKGGDCLLDVLPQIE